MVDEFDFLDQPGALPVPAADSATRTAAAVALEGVRGDLLDWAAAATCARTDHPTRRGRRGELQARQDLDFCVRHVHAALAHGSDGACLDALQQAAALLATRGVDAGQWRADVAVLIEAVRRFVPPPAGVFVARELRTALDREAVAPRVVAR